MTHSISRRTLAKGAAWSVPVVGAAAMVTPASASPPPQIDCGELDLVLQRNAGVVTTYNYAANLITYGANKTAVSIDMGIWHVAESVREKYGVTGFYANPGFCGANCENATTPGILDAVRGELMNGDTFVGTVYTYTPYRCSPQVATTGLTANVTVHTDIPYKYGQECGEAGHKWMIKGISIPYSITFLEGLRQSYKPIGTCCKYLNLTWPEKTCVGNADDITTEKWSDYPLFGEPIE